jgi:hypothetical protein
MKTVKEMLAAFRSDLAADTLAGGETNDLARATLPGARLQAQIYLAWRLHDGVSAAGARRDTLRQMTTPAGRL